MIKEAVYDAFYKLTDNRSQIRSYVFDVVRATVPNMFLDDVRRRFCRTSHLSSSFTVAAACDVGGQILSASSRLLELVVVNLWSG